MQVYSWVMLSTINKKRESPSHFFNFYTSCSSLVWCQRSYTSSLRDEDDSKIQEMDNKSWRFSSHPFRCQDILQFPVGSVSHFLLLFEDMRINRDCLKKPTWQDKCLWLNCRWFPCNEISAINYWRKKLCESRRSRRNPHQNGIERCYCKKKRNETCKMCNPGVSLAFLLPSFTAHEW